MVSILFLFPDPFRSIDINHSADPMRFETVDIERMESPRVVASLDQVRAWLRAYNLETAPWFMEALQSGGSRPLAVVARADDGAVIGGLIGETMTPWLKVKIMAVAPEHRRTGVGAGLLAAAEREGVRRGCRYSTVDTLAFQAPGFYERTGYREAGSLPDWDGRGNAKLFFMKVIGGSE